MHITRRPTTRFLLLFVLLCGGCEDTPEGGADDVARYTEGLIRYRHAEYTSGVEDPSEVATRLESPEKFAEQLYYDCKYAAQHPQLLDYDMLPARTILGSCPDWDSSEFQPDETENCQQAMCVALAAQCVAERLHALSSQVEDYESSRFVEIGGGAKEYIITVPPQSAVANAAMLEVAADWAARAIVYSGENLRSGFAVAGATGDCTDDDSTDAGLLYTLNRITAVNDSSTYQPFAEAFLSTLTDSALLQVELAAAIERSFSAVADAERSRNTSNAVAARYAWITGRTSRARAAHVLLGGDRDEVIDESVPQNVGGLFRVPNGYGSHGGLSTTERYALDDIRSSGIAPSILSGSPSSVVDAVAAALAAQNILPPAEFDAAELMTTRGLSEADFAAAATWLHEAVELFELNPSVMLQEDPSRYAATATLEIVPPDADLVAGVLIGRGGVPTTTYLGVDGRHISAEQARDSVAASIDYAADLVNELAGEYTAIPAGSTRDNFVQALTSGAQAVPPLRTGRVEFCRTTTIGEFPNPGSSSHHVDYAGADDADLVLVAGVDSLRCALTGTLHGAACSVDEYGSSFTISTATAGAHQIRRWFTNGHPPSETFYLLRKRIAGSRVVGYHAVASGRFGGQSLGPASCVIVPLVPFATEAATNLVRPDLSSLDRPALNCVGLPSDQRLPLEDELSDDGDQFESSWRHFLTLAASAATESDRLGEAVINNGIEVERRVEIASARMEGICGGDVDIDFLTSMSGPPNNTICFGQDEGSSQQSGDQGYICRSGIAMPDALETVRVRAGLGDHNALKLLECMGESELVPWVSLGSRDLCIWEDATGAACVGAGAAGVQCPIIRTELTCAGQLVDILPLVGNPAELEVITIDQKLGIFADVIAEGDPPPPPPDGEDGVIPPCGDLRILRSGNMSERGEARDRLRSSRWLNQGVLASEAQRLSWEARPYDYSTLRRQDERWVWTGNPTQGPATPATQWPCGAPLESGLDADPSCGGSEMTPVSGSSTSSALGCAYVSDCTASGAPIVGNASAGAQALLERVRMNQRVGRAALTLRLLTATGMRGMRLPMNVTSTDGDSTDEYQFLEDRADTTYSLPPAGIYFDTYGAALGTGLWRGLHGSRLRARDLSHLNEDTDLSGSAYCVNASPCDPGVPGCIAPPMCASNVGGCSPANMGYLWTYLDQITQFGDSAGCTEACLRANDCPSSCFRIFSPCFTGVLTTDSLRRRAPFLTVSYTGDEAAAPIDAIDLVVQQVWPGVGHGSPAVPNGRQAVVRDALNWFASEAGDPSMPVPLFDESRYGGVYWSTPNDIPLLRDMTYGDVIDGLELACASSRADFSDETAPGAGGVSNDPCSPERLGNLEAGSSANITQLEDQLRCTANLLEASAERMIIRDVPSEVVESVQAELGAATLPVLEGERGVLVSETVADLIALRSYRIQLVRIMRDFAAQSKLLRNELERQGVQRSQLVLRLAGDIADRVTACAVAVSPSVSVGLSGGSVSSNPGAAIATCTNTAIQIVIAIAEMGNNLRLVALDRSDAFTRFGSAFQSHVATLGQIEVELAAAGHRMTSRSTQFGNLRRAAQRSLGEAMLFSSDSSGRQLRVNTLLRRRFTTSQVRYDRARIHAMRMAYLAKIALEQRLGVRLEDLDDELTLVEAPASWESSLCTMSGLDFTRIRDGADPAFESYADQYIGHYVDRLARTAESYRLDFPFHEGSDTAVVSMRDVLLGVRDTCHDGIEVPNLLADSSDLMGSNWSHLDTCEEVDVGLDGNGDPVFEVRNCVQLTRNAPSDGALGLPSQPDLGFALPWRVRFGPPDGSTPTSARTYSRHTQWLADVEPGIYMLSWYGADVSGSPLDASSIFEVSVGGVVQTLDIDSTSIYGESSCDGVANDGWCRHHTFIRVSALGPVGISIAPDATDTATVTGDTLVGPQIVDVAGIQFENMTALIGLGRLPVEEIEPTVFMETNSDGLSHLPVCEDLDGDKFRARWRYDCERHCSTGFRTDCPDEDAELSCFWEHSFEINQEELLSRGRLAATGFATGNFNYRTDRISLNFVGTNVRNCENSRFPSSCYGSGFVNYSVEHLGPYPILNHQGELYFAPLFVGLIENARGLSAERYITNPVSSADRGLIEPYSRSEFRGRPLTGQYVVRIWDDGVVKFRAIEDIQIVLDYRYWTRFR